MATSPQVNTTTGEIVDEVQVRPFAELLTMLDHGQAHAEASRALHDLVAAVRDTGKQGAMTINLKLAPLKGNIDQLVVAAQVTSKPPKSEPSAAMFFVDDAGNHWVVPGVPGTSGQALTLGVRPEHLSMGPEGDGWSAQVETSEMLGAERLVYSRWAHSDADEMVIIRTEESAAVPALGATLHVTPRPDRIHHFDANTGKRT